MANRHQSHAPSPKQKLLERLKALHALAAEALPVVPLREYFEGNQDEGCIAPNQADDGRPPLAELYARFCQIGERPDVEAVLVGLHGDWAEAEKYENDWPAAENIHILTSAPRVAVEEWIAGLASDALLDGWPYGKHPSAPEPRPGSQVFTVCWD